MNTDPRPLCRSCGKPWAPPEGVYAHATSCPKCRRARRASADRAFRAAGKRSVVVAGYGLRVSKNA